VPDGRIVINVRESKFEIRKVPVIIIQLSLSYSTRVYFFSSFTEEVLMADQPIRPLGCEFILLLKYSSQASFLPISEILVPAPLKEIKSGGCGGGY